MAITDGMILQVTVEYQLPTSSLIQNVFHFVVDASFPTQESLAMVALENAITDFYNNVETLMSADIDQMVMYVDELVWNAVEGRWDVFRRVGDSVVEGFVPTGAGEVLPPGVAGLIQLIPLYRKHSGFKYLGGFTETANEADGTPTATAVAAMVAMGTDIITNAYTIETGIAETYVVILNRKLNVWNNPTSALVRNRWSYQRRRKPNVGA